MSVSRDGFLPQSIYTILHPKYATPYRSSILNGCTVAVLAGWMPYQLIVRTVNIGTLYAFLVVCIAVIVLKYKKPNLHRPFKCPFNPFIPALGVLANSMLLVQLDRLAWLRWSIWGCIGLLVYFIFGRRNARKLHPTRYQQLNDSTAPPADTDLPPQVELTPTMKQKKYTPLMATTTLNHKDSDANFVIEDLGSPANQSDDFTSARRIVPSASGMSSNLDDEVFSTASDSQPPTPSPAPNIHKIKHNNNRYETDDNERNALMPTSVKPSDED